MCRFSRISAEAVATRIKWCRVGYRAAALLLALPPAHALAWDGVLTGKVVAFEISAGGNYDLRVYAGASSNPCVGAPPVGWAYINQADGNYQTYASMLSIAFTTFKTVTLYLTRDSSGYCRISHLYIVS